MHMLLNTPRSSCNLAAWVQDFQHEVSVRQSMLADLYGTRSELEETRETVIIPRWYNIDYKYKCQPTIDRER